jgi:hypothetical protein
MMRMSLQLWVDVGSYTELLLVATAFTVIVVGNASRDVATNTTVKTKSAMHSEDAVMLQGECYATKALLL